MSKAVDINVKHVTRVEGHGNIVVKADDGSIEKVEWQVPEAPRFFEAMVRGNNYDDIQTIVSRICGICSASHSLAALKAVEDALDVKVSEQTRKLRILLNYAEQIESHVLHVGYLVAPDLLGVKSVVPLVSSHPDLVKTIIAAHRLGNEMMSLIGGRRTHPVSVKVGGFSRIPTESQLKDLKKKLEDSVPKLKVIAEAVLGLADKLPAFERDTEYISITNPDHYTFYDGDIFSTDIDKTVDIHDFESVANEYVSAQSTAKWTKWHRDSFAVGALARFNNNADQLLPLAKSIADMFGLKKGCCNPYFNNVAQIVEVVQVVEHSLKLIGELLEDGLDPEASKPPKVETKAGEGVGCVEAPRGILFHRYKFDDNGICTGANICIPTNQNHGNIQKDFEELVPQFISADKTEDEIRLGLEMLVRAYDPCISCSTHYLDVEFV
ncbi:MAG: Ni/Fe hydrogenase subunit alpha [Candidatus Krumholzibacteriota bacterium]|nr:Ni/Fe hydrogenase subunit alpha [Candidatus Krumholzibacteriota bacterium]